MIIDVHAHALRERSLEKLGLVKAEGRKFLYRDRKPHPYYVDLLLYDLDGRLKSLEERHIDLQLVGPPPYFIRKAGNENDVEYARILNEQTAQLARESSGRLAGLAVIPWGQPQKCRDEIKRAVGEYGFRGVVIGSSGASAKPLDSEEYAAVFALIEDLGLLVFMHPIAGATRADLNQYSLNVLVGYPNETAIAVSRMIFSGMLERHANLKLVLAHGGGNLAFQKGRIDSGYSAPHYEQNPECRQNITKPPSEYFRNIYFDTCVLSSASLQFLISVVGVDRVVFGSDFPFEIGDARGELALPAIRALSVSDQSAVIGGNIAAALGL
jgi:aminocarboxymuconate-semialdehyde decarboxylase